MAKQTQIEKYKFVEKLYHDVDDAFNVIDVTENVPEHQLDKLLNDIHRLELAINKINQQEIIQEYPAETANTVKHNIDFYLENSNFIKKTILGRKYYDLIISPIKGYISRIYYGRGDRNELAKKFAAMLIHPDNIMIFLNAIKRIAIGTMSDNEFRKIYIANKHKMIGGTAAFEGFISYEQYLQKLND